MATDMAETLRLMNQVVRLRSETLGLRCHRDAPVQLAAMSDEFEIQVRLPQPLQQRVIRMGVEPVRDLRATATANAFVDLLDYELLHARDHMRGTQTSDWMVSGVNFREIEESADDERINKVIDRLAGVLLRLVQRNKFARERADGLMLNFASLVERIGNGNGR